MDKGICRRVGFVALGKVTADAELVRAVWLGLDVDDDGGGVEWSFEDKFEFRSRERS